MRLLSKLTNKEWAEISKKYKDGGTYNYKGKKTFFCNVKKAHTNPCYLGSYSDEEKSWEVIIVLPGVEAIHDWVFRSCKNVETVIMADSVKRIGKEVFKECWSLTHVKFSRNLQYIGHSAFQCCLSLTSIFIPPSCREIGKSSFNGCKKLIILSIPQNVQLGYNVVGKTALLQASPFDEDSPGYRYSDVFQNWLKNRHDKYPLHKLCCREQPSPDLDSYNEIDWYKKDECGVTPVDYFIANFGEDDHIQYLPEYVKHLIRENKLKGMSTDEIVEGQLAWQQQQITSLQSQVAKKEDKITTLQKEKHDYMSLNLLEEEIK